ncbi:gliding motility-associated C-terminal domain-containing protein [Flavobacterium sp. J49]|uniref:PKD-like domain-containing protein n=1 Tax=Flavobacterium sp. J49 TaxID=2718534 RepID=UPI001592E92D|nr:PKD-like domain-containing protein [Flavobacterium sp. J49]MBF6642157.1 gliding motility-associated C-terminal domain-containing protein [Flavobacterium sp. J49]NIC03404.1 T9SS type B sorting domain-containing protein [Flavobacterium sp. J49]
MKQKYFVILLLLLVCQIGVANPLEILPPPSATITGTTTVCQNSTSPVITFTGSDGTAPYTFTYKINNGAPLTVTTNGSNSSVTVPASTATPGVFTYTLVSVEDSSLPPNPINVSGSVIVTVNPQANADLNSSANSIVFNGFTTFRECSNQASQIDFFNSSTTTATNTNYTINWGDGSPNFTGTSWTNLSHTYQVGLWTLTYTITAQNGCNIVKIYKVFVGNNPAVGLGNPGNTDICISSSLTFPITGTDNNPPGTTYVVTFNDGSAPINFNHPPPASVTHNFLISSCGTTSTSGTTTYQNSFFASIAAINPCDQSSASVVPIRISTPPIANFSLPQATVCIGNQICFTNTSTGGDSASSTSCSTPKLIWTISPNTGFTLASGTLGNDFGSTNTNSWLSGSSSICPVFSVTGTYTITLKIGNRCGVDEITKVLCVQSVLTPQFNLNTNNGCIPLAVTATNATNLANQCSAPAYLWQVTHTPLYCAASTVTIPNQTTANATFNFTVPGTYTITLSTINSCGTTTTSQTVTVKKPPTVTVAPISNSCGTANITPVGNVTNCAPTGGTLTYSWLFPGGTPSSSNALNPGTIAYPAGGPYTVSFTATNECGVSNTATQSFTVNTAPVITNSVLSQTICSGSSTTVVNLTANPAGTTFSWTASATAGITGFTSSGTGNTIPIQTITTTNTNAGTVTYVITPTFNGCVGPTVNYVVNVNPAPSITTQPVSSSVCLGGVPTVLTVVLNSSAITPTYQWYSNTTSSTSGGTLIPGATNATYSPPSSAVGTLYYYCVITLSSGGCSSLTSQLATVTINPLPTIVTQPQPTQSICVGGVITSLTASYTGGIGTAAYQWYSNTTNSNSGGTLISGATSATYAPPVFNTAGTYYYYAVITLSGNGCGVTTSNTAEVIVLPDPTITTQPLVTQTQCQNTPANILEVVANGGSGTFSYQWYSNANNNTTTGSAITGATSSTYSPPTTTIGTIYYYCIITQTGLGCSVISTTAAVVTVPAPSISTQPLVSQTVCLNGATTVLSVSYINGIGTPAYQWYSNILNSNSGGTLIGGATNSNFTPPSSSVGTIYYYCIVTFTSGGCTSASSNTATVIVNDLPTIDVQPQTTQSICVGGTISPLLVSYTGGVGTPNYQWYSNTSNSNTGGTAINGATASTYTPPVFTTAGSYYYYVVVTLNGNGCGIINSDTAEVIVVADPIVTAQPLANQTQCQSTTATTLSVSVTGGIGTLSYQWYSNTANNTTNGQLITGQTTDTFTPPTDTIGTTYYYCIITQTGLGCNVTSATASVVVVPSPIITTQPQSATVCEGSVLSPLTVAYTNGTGTASYQWYDDNGPISGAINDTYTPSNTISNTYYCVITFSSGGCTSITSASAVITINPLPTINSQPLSSQSICVGGVIPALAVSYNGGVGTPTYQWYSNTTNSTTGGIPVGTDSPNYTPPTFNTSGTFYFYVTISLNGAGCGIITSDLAAVIVVPDPVLTTQPLAQQTVCQNTPASVLEVIANGGIGSTYSYQWYVSSANNTTSGSIIVGATNSSYTPPTITAGTLYYYCLVTQNAGDGCDVTSAIATVTVNLAPDFTTQPISSTICLGQAPTVLSFTIINGVGTPNYQWYSNAINSATGGIIITGATGATYSPPSNTAGTNYYYCVVTFPSITGGCSVITTNTAEVIINPNPVIAAENVTICSSTTFTVTPTNANGNVVPVGTTYVWSTPSISPLGSVTGATAESIPQNQISQTLINTTTSPATVTYTVTPTSGVCVGNNFTVTVVVNPAINPNVVVNNNLCFGVNTASITTNITGGIPFSTGSPYLLDWTGPNGYTSTNTSISNLSPGVYNVTINDAGGCPFSDTYTITEPADIVITVDSENDITCFNSANGSVNISVTGGTGSYTYTWTQNGGFYAGTEDIANLSPGTYVVSVTDANNCGPKTATFTITQPPLLVVGLSSQTNVLCYGEATGAITVNVSGGTPNPITSDYTYSWTGPNGFTSANQNLNNLIAGVYDLTVTDNQGCVKNLSVTITQSSEILINYTTTPITCYGANNASLSVTISGGNGPYQYQWNNLATTLNQTNLSAGTYIITVTDNVGCVKVQTIVIPEAPIFTVNPIVTNVSCYGANNGSINLNLTGGIAPVALTWSDGSTAGLIRNNLPPGTYTATISDGTPCFIVRTFTIIEPQPLVLSANITNPLDCNVANSGAINLIVSGGTGPFVYSWTNGVTSEDLTNLNAGNYLVTVTDANNCTTSGQYTLTRPAPIVIAVTTQTDFDCASHEVTQNFVAQASGGVPPYQYQWSSGNVSGANGQIMSSDLNGTVILTVTDNVGCNATYTVDVDNPEIGYASFEATSYGYTTYGIYSIGDPIQFNSTITGDYVSVSWDFGDGTFSTELNPVHTYFIPRDYVVTQTVTYPFGCVYVQTITLIVEKGYLLVVPTAFTPNDDSVNDTYRPVTKRLKNVRLDIYDTWGSIVYTETGEVLVGWDGKINGFNAENGNYYSKVTAETFYGTIVNENQTFVLIK